MGRRSAEYRAEARRLDEQAESSDDNARLILRGAARRLHEIADEIERHEVDCMVQVNE